MGARLQFADYVLKILLYQGELNFPSYLFKISKSDNAETKAAALPPLSLTMTSQLCVSLTVGVS